MDRCERTGFTLPLSDVGAVANDRVGVFGASKNGLASHDPGARHVDSVSAGKRLHIDAPSLAIYRTVVLDDTGTVGGVTIWRGSV